MQLRCSEREPGAARCVAFAEVRIARFPGSNEMKHGKLLMGIAVALCLTGCGLLQINGKPLALGSSAEEEKGTPDDQQGSAPRLYTPPPEAKERLAECGAKIEESRKAWAEQEKKTRAAIKASEQAGLYDGWLGLMNQYRDNCQARDKVHPSAMVFRSTAIELSLAVARFQVRQGLFMRSPLTTGDQASEASTWVPLGDDAAFNSAESCRSLGRDVDYLTTDEFNAWKAKHDPLVKEQAEAIDKLFAALNDAAPKIGADYGRVKKIQKLPDGGVRLSMANLYGGSACVHTGQWRFNGTFWTDCDYVGAPEKEIYPFTASFSAQRIPKDGLQVGDVVMFWGIRVKAGPDAKYPKEGAEYDGLVVTDQMRRNKPLVKLPSFERTMDCVRFE